MLCDEVFWAWFAQAALMSGEFTDAAAKTADKMLEQYKKRFRNSKWSEPGKED